MNAAEFASRKSHESWSTLLSAFYTPPEEESEWRFFLMPRLTTFFASFLQKGYNNVFYFRFGLHLYFFQANVV